MVDGNQKRNITNNWDSKGQKKGTCGSKSVVTKTFEALMSR